MGEVYSKRSRVKPKRGGEKPLNMTKYNSPTKEMIMDRDG